MSKNFADNDNMTALMTAVGNKLSEKSKIFYGSETDWNNLTVAQKKEYDYWASPEIVPNYAKAGFTPIGTIISVMGNSAPVNYLPCNGQAVNIVDYPELADYFEQQFGSKNKFGGDGITTFCLPDLRGEFLRGTGTNVHTNQGSGANVGSHQDGTVIPWSGTSSNATGINFRKKDTTSANLPSNMDSQIGLTKGMSGITATYNATGSSSDLGERYTVRPTNTSVLYCIATKNIYLDPSQDYSTSEKVVGHWIDGKPIYQKTVSFGGLPNNTTKQVNHNISNIDNIISYDIIAFRNDNAVFYNVFSMPSCRAFCGKTDITVISTADVSSYPNAYVTMKYTKTTD